jgi:hypothetical protein
VTVNDGEPVAVRALGEAVDGRIDRSDFHALCSSDTSRKRACEQIDSHAIEIGRAEAALDPAVVEPDGPGLGRVERRSVYFPMGSEG